MKRVFAGVASRRGAVVALASGMLVAAVVAGSAVSATSGSSAMSAIIPPKKCGDNITYKKADPDKVLRTLPAALRVPYGSYPVEVRATPWKSFKKKPGPWTIGYVGIPINHPWKVTFLNQLKKEFAAAKAKGLVTGSMRMYIQPDFNTATPEQQSAAIQQMVRDGVDGILLHPLDSKAETPAIDAAGKAGVPVVLAGDFAPNSKYAINIANVNNILGQAEFLKMLVGKGWFKGETRRTFVVRGIQGNTLEEAINTAAVAQMKPCKGLEMVGTVWGQWSPATTKAETLKFLASHPGDFDFVMQEDAVAAGIIQAFEQLGKPVPTQPFNGVSGGDLSWWLKNKSTYSALGYAPGGAATAYSSFQVLMRILDGRQLKIRDIVRPGVRITNANVGVYATPGKPVTWLGDIRGPKTSFLGPAEMNGFFVKPRNP
jgi:ribose transport system substrate-binding protein